jgi:hypothetical protein
VFLKLLKKLNVPKESFGNAQGWNIVNGIDAAQTLKLKRRHKGKHHAAKSSKKMKCEK